MIVGNHIDGVTICGQSVEVRGGRVFLCPNWTRRWVGHFDVTGPPWTGFALLDVPVTVESGGQVFPVVVVEVAPLRCPAWEPNALRAGGLFGVEDRIVGARCEFVSRGSATHEVVDD